MKKISLFIASFFLYYAAVAQDTTMKRLQAEANKPVKGDAVKGDAHDTTGKVWKKGGLFSVNIAQGSLSNWQGGGDKFSFSSVGLLNLFAFYQKGKDAWDNTFDFGYGYVKTTSLGSRKSDDRINITSKYGHQIAAKWKASMLFDLRTQFSKGYNYTKNTAGQDVRELTSNFLAPGYVLLSVGFDFKPNSDFSLFLSPLTERYIIVADDYLSSIGAFGVDPGSHKRNELGAFLSATYNKEIVKNITYKSKLDAFSNYKHEPQNVDIFWNNILAMKVNQFISTNIIFDLLYDDDAIARWQVRQLLGIGISAKF
jgi:hypothetical protein